jgi:hypothetical protein
MPLGDGIRRNMATITVEEKHRLREAIIALQQRAYPGARSDTPPGGVTFWFKQDEIHANSHVHNCPAFLPWHRELINRLEDSLREIDPMLSLHYWDWTTDPHFLFTPDFMGSASGPAGDPWLTAGFYDPTATPFRSDNEFDPNNNPFDAPRTLTRSVGSGAPVTPAQDSATVAAGDFPTMNGLLTGSHNGAHGFIGGTIGNPHTSFRDPFVFLLHSNVDRLFALWQVQPGQGWRLDPNLVYGADSNSTGSGDVDSGFPFWGILSPLEPWASPAAQTPATGIVANVHPTRPWAPPENQQVVKDSKHPSVVTPAPYDSFALVHLPTKNSGYLTQGRFGRRGNFEVGAFLPGRLAHLWRNNDLPNLPWSPPNPFGASAVYEAVSLTQSNFSSSGHGAGNLEVVARTGNQLNFYWRDDSPPFAWHGPFPVASGTAGAPGLIQGYFGTRGNFELVTPAAGGGLRHLWRNNDVSNLPWSSPTPFGSGPYGAAALIQSNFTASGHGPGNLEVVALSGNQLRSYWREDVPPFSWHGPGTIAPGVRGAPSFIQSRFGIRGNFELIVPGSGSRLLHLWRNNDLPNLPWSPPTSFGANVTYDSVSVVQSNFTSSGHGPGNLEVVARTGNHLHFYWREDAPPFTWHGPSTIASL